MEAKHKASLLHSVEEKNIRIISIGIKNYDEDLTSISKKYNLSMYVSNFAIWVIVRVI